MAVPVNSSITSFSHPLALVHPSSPCPRLFLLLAPPPSSPAAAAAAVARPPPRLSISSPARLRAQSPRPDPARRCYGLVIGQTLRRVKVFRGPVDIAWECLKLGLCSRLRYFVKGLALRAPERREPALGGPRSYQNFHPLCRPL